MKPDDLKAIQAGTVEEVHKAVSGIKDAADLAALRKLEEAEASPRKGVMDALDARAVELADKPAPKTGKVADSAAAKSEKAWQARDYDGPLTGDQAAWRNANLKPVEKVVTK
jgi:hypothetical protein